MANYKAAHMSMHVPSCYIWIHSLCKICYVLLVCVSAVLVVALNKFAYTTLRRVGVGLVVFTCLIVHTYSSYELLRKLRDPIENRGDNNNILTLDSIRCLVLVTTKEPSERKANNNFTRKPSSLSLQRKPSSQRSLQRPPSSHYSREQSFPLAPSPSPLHIDPPKWNQSTFKSRPTSPGPDHSRA